MESKTLKALSLHMFSLSDGAEGTTITAKLFTECAVQHAELTFYCFPLVRSIIRINDKQVKSW